MATSSHAVGNQSGRPTRHPREENVPKDYFYPHSYQVQLLDAAIRRNTIIFLATSSGKTFIATMLINELAHQVRVPFKDGGKISIFLVPNVSLVQQQARYIQMHTDLTVGEYVGPMAAESNNSSFWQKQFNGYQVLIMTAQNYLDILQAGFISLDKLNLLVFDECHWALQNHPYAQILKYFDDCPVDTSPRVLGLTSSLYNSKCSTPVELDNKLVQLEKKMHCCAVTATNLFTSDFHAARPQESVVEFGSYEDQTGLMEQINEILRGSLSFIDDAVIHINEEDQGKSPLSMPKSVFLECQNSLHILGPWCCGKVAQTMYKQLEKVAQHEYQPLLRNFFLYTLTQLRLIMFIVERKCDTEVMSLEDFHLYVSPKILRLVEILHTYKPDDNFVIIGGDNFMDGAALSDDDSLDLSNDSDLDDLENDKMDMNHYVAVKRKEGENGVNEDSDRKLCGIVFVKNRYMAFALNKVLQELCMWDENLYFVHSRHITGHVSSRGIGENPEAMMIHKKQEEILQKFRQKDLNLLVSTSMLEEGVDVPKCNLVVRFDVPDTFRSYVQSKSRAKATKSEFYIMVEEGMRSTFEEDLSTFKGIEQILMSRCHQKEELSGENEEIPDNVDDLLPAYMPHKPDLEEEAPKVTLSSAIHLVNRYCAKLPSDSFTHLTPSCTTECLQVAPPRYTCKLQLPINSPVKEPIMGVEMPGIKLAQMAVALKTCEVLHQAGELDDNLLPVGKELIRYEDEENEWEEAEALGQARPGSTKRKQYYIKKEADSLLGHVQPESEGYLYIINLTLTCPISDEQNTRGRRIHAPQDTPRCFGLFNKQKLPQVPQFPVFTRSGEVTVSIDLATTISLTAEELEKAETFHHFIFRRVLRVEKDPMLFCPEEASVSYLILPILIGSQKDDVTIDWVFLDSINNSPGIPSGQKCGQEEELVMFEFKDHLFNDAVVMPSYRNIDQPQYFYVAEIRHDLHPKSKFPSPELYDTFEEYYGKKYGLLITNLNQPLLDVDHTSARLNLLTPRYMNQKGVALPTSSAETRRARRENLQQKQILVPELCDIHPFPASLWRKTVCLPAILYRLNYLLIANELRVIIADGTGIGRNKLDDPEHFQKLDFGFSTKPLSTGADTDSDDSSTKSENSEVSSAELKATTADCKLKEGEPDENEALDSCVCDKNKMKNHTDSDEVASSSKTVQSATKFPNGVNTQGDGEMTPSENRDANTPSVVKVQEEPVSSHEAHEQKDVASTKLDEVKPELLSIGNLSLEDSDARDRENLPNTTLRTEHTIPDKTPSAEKEEPISEGSRLQMDVAMETKSQTDGVKMEKRVETSQRTGCNGLCEKKTLKNGSLKHDLDLLNSDLDPQCDLRNCSNINDLTQILGPSPCTLLQTLTMSNANDFFNLERLETIGDSFLKFAVTVYLYCTYPGIHEGKLSYLRSKQVSNYNLYRLGKAKGLAECMIASKFEPGENWLPPGYITKPEGMYKGLNIQVRAHKHRRNGSDEQEMEIGVWTNDIKTEGVTDLGLEQAQYNKELENYSNMEEGEKGGNSKDSNMCLIPYDLRTQHSLPDKSIADCVEALIGCYLTTCKERAALKFMSWLGLKVLPEQLRKSSSSHLNNTKKNTANTSETDAKTESENNDSASTDQVSSTKRQPEQKVHHALLEEGMFMGLKMPPSPLLTHVPNAADIVEFRLDGYREFEDKIGYRFRDRSYLLQAFTHASYHYNNVTDCYQRLEFLGDAILDYVITRHLFQDARKHSPGVLTDLRSALVNNNIFAALAVKWDFHKYFKAISPQLFHVVDKFVNCQKSKGDTILLDEDLEEDGEDEVDIEIPKVLADIFESVAGAIYLDSGMSLEAVWRVYYSMMKQQIEQFTAKIPLSPVRELLEMEPETAKFDKPEKTMDGKMRVVVNVVGKGTFQGVGRNYRIAKSTAARRALKYIKSLQQENQEQVMMGVARS